MLDAPCTLIICRNLYLKRCLLMFICLWQGLDYLAKSHAYNLGQSLWEWMPCHRPRSVLLYKLRYIVGFELIEMANSTNLKPKTYRKLYTNLDPAECNNLPWSQNATPKPEHWSEKRHKLPSRYNTLNQCCVCWVVSHSYGVSGQPHFRCICKLMSYYKILISIYWSTFLHHGQRTRNTQMSTAGTSSWWMEISFAPFLALVRGGGGG